MKILCHMFMFISMTDHFLLIRDYDDEIKMTLEMLFKSPLHIGMVTYIMLKSQIEECMYTCTGIKLTSPL